MSKLFLYPTLSAINKGLTVHVCSFIIADNDNSSNYVIRSGTLVLDEHGFCILSERAVTPVARILNQPMMWEPVLKEDRLLNKWYGQIRKCLIDDVAMSKDETKLREEELKFTGQQMQSERNEGFIFIKGHALFRNDVYCNRLVWTRSLVGF